MAANATSGPHGRDIAAAETASTKPFENGPLDRITFGDVLDALNPLQYVPVVGTIYRVCTGDQGSPGLRTALSMIVGAATGGPVGLLTSIASTLVERFFHVEQAARSVVAPPPAPADPATPPPSPVPLVASHVAPAANPDRAPAPAPELVARVDSVPAAVAREAVAAYARTEAAGARLTWGGRER